MANSAQLGSWSGTVSMPIVPVAAAMLPTGTILVWSSYDPLSFEGDIGLTPSNTLISFCDPSTGTVSNDGCRCSGRYVLSKHLVPPERGHTYRGRREQQPYDALQSI